HTASFAFSSAVRQALLPLSVGGTLVIATQEQVRAPLSLFEMIRRLDVTVVDIVPTYLRTCIHILLRLEEAARRELLHNRLRLILSASERLASDIPRLWARSVGHGAAIINMYGQTETAGIVTAQPVMVDDEAMAAGVPVGRPVGDSAVYVLNDQLQPAAIGAPGEVHVGGPCVSRGYLNQTGLTGQKFVDDPFGERPGRLYRTGDLGRFLADGRLQLLGRVDSQIKIRGFRVE